MSKFFELATIVVVGVIIADFIGGFYVKGTSNVAPFGGGSGVIVSGVVNMWKDIVDVLSGQGVTAPPPAGPKAPGAQQKPPPKLQLD